MKVKFLVGYIDGGDPFIDEADIKCAETAKEEVEEMIKDFNEIESFRYGKEARLRKLIKIETIDDDENV